MTIPTLVANHRKTVVETRLAKFYSTINQAILMAENDYGDRSTWEEVGQGTNKDENGNILSSKAEDWFNKYLKPYLNYSKAEYDGNSEGKIVVYFTDGSLVMISNSSFLFYPQAKDYEKIEQDDSINRNHDLCGTKYFTFMFNPFDNTAANKYHYKKGVEPYKYNWNGTEDMLWNNNTIGCKKEVSNERAYCTALIQMNGWKIPKNYPLRF